jgi:cytochrome P450
MSARNFKDPQSYIPERWLDNNPQFASDNREALQPFSIGPRNCIGKNLALVEMRLILARFLWNFDIELADSSKDWMEQKVFLLWEKDGMNVKVTPRKVR